MAKRKEWVFDWKQSLVQNFFWLIMVALIYAMTVQGLLTVASIEDQWTKLMGTVFTLFFTLKMFGMIRYPKIVLKERK